MDEFRFEATLLRNGRALKRSLKVMLPAKIQRAIVEQGWLEQVYVRLEDGIEFPMELTVNGTTLCVPTVLDLPYQVGDRLHVTIRPRKPIAIPTKQWGKTIDLAAWLAPNADAFDMCDGLLHIRTARSGTMTVKRYIDFEKAAWALGFYQAEGSKKGLSFILTQRDPYLLAEFINSLVDDFGIDKSALYVQPLYSASQNPMDVCRDFKVTGVSIKPPRMRTSKGREAGHLSFEASIEYVQIWNSLLADMQRDLETLDSAVVWQYCRGYLEGDGTITYSRSNILLRVFGLEQEVSVVCRALSKGFGWTEDRFKYHPDTSLCVTGERSLNLFDTARLIREKFFRFSMSRARMLFAFENNSKNLRSIYNKFGGNPFTYQNCGISAGVVNMLVKWGWVDKDPFRLTARAIVVCEAYKEFLPELELLKKHVDADKRGVGESGVKWHHYPLAPGRVEIIDAHSHQRRIQLKEAVKSDIAAVTDLAGVSVKRISKDTAKTFIERFEWLGTLGVSQACYGLLLPWRGHTSAISETVDGEQFEVLGVASFGRSAGSLSHAICEGVPLTRGVCLARGACVHYAPKNAASFLISKATQKAHEEFGWLVFHAFADALAGEYGAVYQAANWHYIGQPSASNGKIPVQFMRPDGQVVSSRSLHPKTRAEVLAEGWIELPSVPKHKYVWFEGSPSEKKRLRDSCKYPFLPYPKPDRTKAHIDDNALGTTQAHVYTESVATSDSGEPYNGQIASIL